jgi:cysteine synthase
MLLGRIGSGASFEVLDPSCGIAGASFRQRSKAARDNQQNGEGLLAEQTRNPHRTQSHHTATRQLIALAMNDRKIPAISACCTMRRTKI